MSGASDATPPVPPAPVVPLDGEEIDGDDGVLVLEPPEKEVAEWMAGQLADEVKRVRGMGQRVLPLSVLKTSLVRQEITSGGSGAAKKGSGAAAAAAAAAKTTTRIINAVELNTSFDFKSVPLQLLLSDATPCPVKEGFEYVNVVLVTTAPRAPPLIFGYIYKKDVEGNGLQYWRLTNTDGEEVTLAVNTFDTIN